MTKHEVPAPVQPMQWSRNARETLTLRHQGVVQYELSHLFCPWCTKFVDTWTQEETRAEKWYGGADGLFIGPLCFPCTVYAWCTGAERLHRGLKFRCSNCDETIAIFHRTLENVDFFLPVGEKQVKAQGPRNLAYTTYNNDPRVSARLAKESTDLLVQMCLMMEKHPECYLDDAFYQVRGHISKQDGVRAIVTKIWHTHFAAGNFGPDELNARVEDAYKVWKDVLNTHLVHVNWKKESESPWVEALAWFLNLEFGPGPDLLKQFNNVRETRNIEQADLIEWERIARIAMPAVTKVLQDF